MFATSDNDGKLLVTRIQGTTATTTIVAGTYGKLAESPPPLFSPGDRWIAVSTDDGAYVLTNDGGTFGSPVGGGMAVSAPFGQPRIRFSPDGLLLATGESASMGRKADVTIVDLRQAAPSTSRLSFPSAYDGSSVFDLGWSAHATELAVLLQDGAYPAVTNVYLVSADGPSKGSTLNLSDRAAAADPCRSATAFRFQPERRRSSDTARRHFIRHQRMAFKKVVPPSMASVFIVCVSKCGPVKAVIWVCARLPARNQP